MNCQTKLGVCCLLLSLFSLSCQEKKSFNSLQETGYHGKVSKVREEFWIKSNTGEDHKVRPTISIHYYTKAGQQVKVERLNSWEDDVPSLNYTAVYQWKGGRPVSYQAVDRKQNPVEKGTYTWSGSNQYSLDVEAVDGMRSHVERILDEKGRVKESFSQYKLPRREDMYENRMLIQRDEKGDLIKTVTIPKNGELPETTRFVYATKDQQGNGTLIYLLREKAGDTVATYIRQFEYY